MASVNRYWWAIGMTGTVTPAIRPISGANMPPALTTTSVAIVLALALGARPSTPRDPPAVRRRSPRPACAGGSWRHASARPPRAPARARTGRASRRSAARPRRARRRSTSAGTGPAPPPRPMSSRGSPNVLAQPAWRCSSSSRSGVDASRSDPTSCQDGSTPVSAASRRYSSAPYIIIRVSVTELRSWPDEPGRVERRARSSARPDRRARCRSSRARPGDTRSTSRRRRRR